MNCGEFPIVEEGRVDIWESAIDCALCEHIFDFQRYTVPTTESVLDLEYDWLTRRKKARVHVKVWVHEINFFYFVIKCI